MFENRLKVSNTIIFLSFSLQILDSPLRPHENKTVIRVLQGSNLSARNTLGQTILFEAMARDEPEDIISAILAGGVNVAARDVHGSTARDFATKLQKPNYVRLIDNHVLKLIKNKDFLKVRKYFIFISTFIGDPLEE